MGPEKISRKGDSMEPVHRYYSERITACKNQAMNLVLHGALNSNYGLSLLRSVFNEIELFRRVINEDRENVDVVERFNDYTRPWDHDNGNALEEQMFFMIGEPSDELKAHMKEKERHRKRYARRVIVKK